ncbi:MAG: hypothetical protein IK066_06325, partial [Kiritimatiellae bacterium]|nr:hypothetical protein [Kiritimatiellia bacterium]
TAPAVSPPTGTIPSCVPAHPANKTAAKTTPTTLRSPLSERGRPARITPAPLRLCVVIVPLTP